MTWLYCIAIFLSSCLLFLVQPLCAKMLLPLLGGTPAVWNTCMVFFQAGLLLGYAYAHVLPRWLGVSRHALLHVALLIVAAITLPIRLPDEVASGWHPVLWLLASLAGAVGIPFVLLAAGAPLLQRWFVCKHHLAPRDPYFLYAASNLGSFLALGLFPFVLEPWFTLTQQSDLWRFGFLAVTALMAFCVPLGVQEAATASAAEPTPTWKLRGRWIALSLIPSSLLLSVTTHVTTDVAAIPLLWLIPMGLYLLTFTAAFASRQLAPQALLVRWLPMVVIVVSIVLLSEATQPLALVLGVHLLGFVWLALLCHGELARTRPVAEHLTDFYLCLALGGVLGGTLSALIAPLIFTGLSEYPLMIVAACYFGMAPLIRPNRADWLWAAGIGALTVALILIMQSTWLAKFTAWLETLSVLAMFGVPFILCYIAQERPARFALSLAAVLAASSLQHGVHGTAVYRERSYYGIHRVTEKDGLRRLVHGDTVHGQQSLDPELRREPLTYYSKNGPIGDVFRAVHGDSRLQRVGIVGLGAGSLAAFAQPGDDWTFFEIDPSVQRIAENPKLFTYLHDARGTIHIDLGDARLQLKNSKQTFGVLIVDAFGSDAIPLHLLTREAMQVYLDHLEPNGLLAFHISNNYVDLEPVLARLGESVRPGLVGYVRQHGAVSKSEKAQGIMPSDWAVFARTEGDWSRFWRTRGRQWRPVKTRRTSACGRTITPISFRSSVGVTSSDRLTAIKNRRRKAGGSDEILFALSIDARRRRQRWEAHRDFLPRLDDDAPAADFAGVLDADVVVIAFSRRQRRRLEHAHACRHVDQAIIDEQLAAFGHFDADLRPARGVRVEAPLFLRLRRFFVFGALRFRRTDLLGPVLVRTHVLLGDRVDRRIRIARRLSATDRRPLPPARRMGPECHSSYSRRSSHSSRCSRRSLDRKRRRKRRSSRRGSRSRRRRSRSRHSRNKRSNRDYSCRDSRRNRSSHSHDRMWGMPLSSPTPPSELL